jgi:transcriptional regulator with XRE-family HTH domain
LEYSNIESTLFGMKKKRLAALLRQVRLDADLTQSQLAEKIGQTQSYVSKYENGEQRLDLIELEAVCKAVGISLTDFVGRYLEG